MLGVEDRGILTCWLNLDFGGSGQGFGGYALDQWDEEKDARLGTAYGMEFIRRLMNVVGVEKWEDLVGKHVRAETDWSRVHRIGHITRDKWFNPSDLKE